MIRKYSWHITLMWLALLLATLPARVMLIGQQAGPISTLLSQPERLGFDGLSDFERRSAPMRAYLPAEPTVIGYIETPAEPNYHHAWAQYSLAPAILDVDWRRHALVLASLRWTVPDATLIPPTLQPVTRIPDYGFVLYENERP